MENYILQKQGDKVRNRKKGAKKMGIFVSTLQNTENKIQNIHGD
jgi:hypothetical protein